MLEKNSIIALLSHAVQKIYLMAMRMAGKETEELTALPKSNDTTIDAVGLPGTQWVFGCSSGAAESIARGYEQPKAYTDPANDDVTPLDDSSWPTWSDVAGDTYSNNPLAASPKGVKDGITRGAMDDYWVGYNGAEPDPYKSDE
jgi:hypothetical protein